MNKPLPFIQIPENIKTIIEQRVYDEMPVHQLARKNNKTIDEIKEILAGSDNKRYLDHCQKEKRLISRRKYNKLANLSYKALKEILTTPHTVEIFDKTGTVPVGQRINPDIMKIKEKVASDVLQNVGAKKGDSKKPFLQFNQQINNKEKEKAVLQDNHQKMVEKLINDCRVIEMKPEQN